MPSFIAPPSPAVSHHDEPDGAYVNQTLGATEVVLAQAHFHRLQWGLAIVLAVLFGWLIVPLYWIVPAIVRMATTEIVVTNQRLVLKTGWLDHATNEMPLNAIESIEVYQTFWQRLLGIGRIVVNGSGGGIWRTPSFAEALAFRRAIENAAPAIDPGAAKP
jgi:uncharacterized membrane protein YdbT with pleckstrin-like domain